MNIVKFALLHKPTKKWVKIISQVYINLVDNVCDATLEGIGPDLEDNLKYCHYKGNINYGKNNFLEFELKKINIKYTILDD